MKQRRENHGTIFCVSLEILLRTPRTFRITMSNEQPAGRVDIRAWADEDTPLQSLIVLMDRHEGRGSLLEQTNAWGKPDSRLSNVFLEALIPRNMDLRMNLGGGVFVEMEGHAKSIELQMIEKSSLSISSVCNLTARLWGGARLNVTEMTGGSLVLQANDFSEAEINGHASPAVIRKSETAWVDNCLEGAERSKESFWSDV